MNTWRKPVVFFDRALALDPDHLQALVGTALVDLNVGANFSTDDRLAPLAAAEATLIRVLSQAPRYPLAHMLLGVVYSVTNRAARGIAECEQALMLNGNLADAHAIIGWSKFLLGRGEETETHVLEALRLSPRDTFAFRWMAFIGLGKLQLGADEEAVAWLRRSIEANRNLPLAHFHLTAALALLGQLDEARAAAQAGLALDPGLTSVASELALTLTIRCTSPNASASMRACGWPGCRKGEGLGDARVGSIGARGGDLTHTPINGSGAVASTPAAIPMIARARPRPEGLPLTD